MERMEDIVAWIIGGLFTALSGVIGWLYSHLNSRITETDKRMDTAEKDVVHVRGEIKRLEEVNKANSNTILQEIRHIRELIERNEKSNS